VLQAKHPDPGLRILHNFSNDLVTVLSPPLSYTRNYPYHDA